MLRELCLERWTRWKQQARLQHQRWKSERAHAMPLDKRVRRYPKLFILLRYGAAEGTEGYWVGSLNQRGEQMVSVCDDEEAALRAEDYLLRVGAPVYENSEEWQDAVAQLAAGELQQRARVRGRRASGGR